MNTKISSGFILGFCFFLSSTFAQVPVNGLVAYYPLAGNAADSSGYNNHGTMASGVTATADRFSNSAKALAFSGSSSQITTSAASQINASGISNLLLSCWIKPT